MWLLAALLALMTLALYWPATRCDFIGFDDPDYVTENPYVQSGLTWAGVKWAFSNTKQADYWAPMMWLSHQLACQFFGLNPWGHHLINVLLHTANTVLVFLLFQRLTGATWRSFLVAALFGWHPLRVESVTWVTERKDVLSTCFGLLSLLFYVRYAQKQLRNGIATSALDSRPSTFDYIWALLFFALGLMSKAILVTWPFVMLLLDYWPLQRFKLGNVQRLATEKIPFFALAVVISIVTFITQKHGGAVMSIETLPLDARMGNALISYCRYLGKLFWPVDLAVFYPHPGYWPMAEVLLASGLLLVITVVCIAARRRYPFILMGWLWFVGTLVPVIGLVQAGAVAMADRFTYMPSLGILILAIWGMDELTRRWRYCTMVLSVAGLVVVVLCLGMTRQQLGYWRDSETLFRHALAVTKDNYLAHKTLGDALFKKRRIDEAISQFQEAIHLKPDYADTHNNLGLALNEKGQVTEAINQLQEAIRLKPDFAEAHNNLGNVLVVKGQTDEAISQFQEAIRLKPDFADAHNNLGTALGGKDQTTEAINQLQEAARLAPNDANIHYNLGIALLKKNQIDEVINQFQEAVRLAPNNANAHYNLGTALGRKGQTDEAISQFQEAIQLKPDYFEAHYNLGTALGRKGQTNEAISQFQEVIRLKPDFAKVRYNLGNIYLEKGQTDEAINQFQEALRLKPDYAEARRNLAHALELKNAPANR
jgi:protein O-mannosyl-transferase